MKIGLSAESTVDLTKEMIADMEVNIIPYSILLGDKDAYDGEITTDEIIESVNQTGVLPKTSAINEFTYKEYFSSLLAKGYDRVIHFTLSGEMSSSNRNAVNASNDFGGKVKVIDSRSLSTGIALLVLYAYKLIKKGESFDTIAKKCEERIPFINASFVLERLDYLFKGGRCSALSYFGANLLKLKPQIVVQNGKMSPLKKFRGSSEMVVRKYCEETFALFDNPDLEEAFVTYTTATPEMVETAKQMLIDRGFKNIHVTRAGATITSHCGEHCLGILYINDGGKN